MPHDPHTDKAPPTRSEDDWIGAGSILHAAGSVANADTYLVDWEGGTAVLKTFRRRPWLMRVLFTRWTLAHEVAVMQALDDVPGVPRILGRLGKDSFVMEYVRGAGPLQSHRQVPPERYPPREFFIRLREMVLDMHRRGVSHGDMRRRNIMQGDDGRPYLIDFATAVIANGPVRPLRRRLMTWFAQADRFALAKLIDSYYPDLVSADERRRLTELPWYLRAGRFFRQRVYRPFIKQKRWRERWQSWRGRDSSQA